MTYQAILEQIYLQYYPQLKKFKLISKMLGNKLRMFLRSNSNALGAAVVVVVVELVVVTFRVVVGICLVVLEITLTEVVITDAVVVGVIPMVRTCC